MGLRRLRRKKTVKGFTRTGTAFGAAVVFASLAFNRWWNGHAMWVVAALGAAAAVAGVLALWALSVDADRAFGPPGSPERQRRRLGGSRLARILGVAVLLGVGFVLFMRYVVEREPTPSLARLLVAGVLAGLTYGTLFAWSTWAAVDEDREPDATAIPAPPRPAAPPLPREVHRRRGEVVCALLAALGLAAGVQAAWNHDWLSAGVGLALAAGSVAIAVWVVVFRD